MIYALLIVFFCFFYTALVFNARDTADNLKKSGAFIPGIRPGQQTGEYIDQVLTRLTLWGALYVTAVCLLPEILISSQGVPFHFGGTSLLIVVVVVMDFMSQLQAHMMSHHYPGLLKKANLLGYGRSGRLSARLAQRTHESTSVGQEDLQELQDRAPPARGLRDLHGPSATSSARVEVRQHMARIAGINIPMNKHVWVGLTHIYGVGQVARAQAPARPRASTRAPRSRTSPRPR